jgi:hypothetical protein
MAGRNRFTAMATHVAAHHGDVPLLRLALGLVMIAFFLLALMVQIQSSEAFILAGSKVTPSTVDWGVISQPVALAQGSLPLDTVKAVLWGWGIELVYLVCVIGETTVHRHVGWFRTGAVILVGFNFWTDFNYGTLASGPAGQFAFAGIAAFVVAFFGVIGLNLVFSAINDMSHA